MMIYWLHNAQSTGRIQIKGVSIISENADTTFYHYRPLSCYFLDSNSPEIFWSWVCFYFGFRTLAIGCYACHKRWRRSSKTPFDYLVFCPKSQWCLKSSYRFIEGISGNSTMGDLHYASSETFRRWIYSHLLPSSAHIWTWDNLKYFSRDSSLLPLPTVQ